MASAGSGWIKVANSGLVVSNLAFVSVTGATSTIAFVQTDLPIGSGDMAVALGDFNGDGILDIVAGPASGSTISVFLGNGDGSYQAAKTSTAPGQSSIAVGDFNHDGLLDVAIASFNAGSVSILLGNGDGTFQAPTTYNTSDGYNVVAGDFNGDGKLDIAVAEYGESDGVNVYLGNGDGTLQAPVNYATGGGPYGIVTADFNGDGKLDLAIGNHNGSATISILLGNGDGTFQTQTTYTVGNNPLGLAVGDFNGDGKPDLAVTSQSDGSVSILLGDGTGAFPTRTTYGTFSTAFTVAVGDLNGDGKLDLAISGSNPKASSILLGNGDGTFQTQLTFGTASFGWTAAMGDLDASGRLGLAIADDSSGKVHVLLQGVVLTPSPLAFPSQAVGTTSAVHTITLTNATGSAVTVSAITFTGTNLADFFETDNCVGTPVASAGTCAIQVTFSPSVTGAETATLSVADNSHGSPQTASLTGTGAAAPIVLLAPAGLVFTVQSLSTTSAAQTVTLSNTGNATLSGIAITLTGSNSGDFTQMNTCSATLLVTTSCTISVTFSPTLVGSESASLSIADNAAGTPQTVPLSGTGAQITPTISWAPPAVIVYGTALTIAQLNATTTVAGTFVYTPAAATVLSAGAQTLSVTFMPTDTVTYASNTATVPLTVAPSFLTLTVVNATKIYAAANPAFSGTITGLVNGDVLTETFATTATTTSVVGNYSIVPSVTGEQAANYIATPTNGTLSITAAPLAIAASIATRAYGAANPTFTGTISGTVNGDTLTESFSTVATVTSVPGAYPIVPLAAGTHIADYTVTPTNGVLTLTTAGTSTTLAPVTAAFAGQAVTLTATVTPATSGLPTGTVTFLDGATTLGAGPVSGTGTASFSSSVFSGGAHSFTAVYAGDTNFTGSTSTALAATVSASFTVTATSAPVQAVPGTPVTTPITIPPLGGAFNAAVTLSATGLPAGATVTFTPAAVTPGSAGATSTMTVTFPPAVVGSALIPTRNLPFAPLGLTSLAAYFFFLRRKRLAKALSTSLLLAVLLASVLAIAGCSGGFGAGSSAPRAVVVTVTGTSGTLQVSTAVTFNLR